MSTKRLLVIVGPTGSGKTDLSIRLAGHYAAPILSTDSRQVYRGMPIGTAQPTFDQLQAIEHHFIASHDIKDYLSCGEYEVQALARLEKLFAGHDYVVAVGGAGLYVRALCEGMDDLPQADEIAARGDGIAGWRTEGLGALAEKLRDAGPGVLRGLSTSTIRRVSCGHWRYACKPDMPYSRQRTGIRASASVRNREDRRRPAARGACTTASTAGWTGCLPTVWKPRRGRCTPTADLNALQTVGYREFFDYFDGRIALRRGRGADQTQFAPLCQAAAHLVPPRSGNPLVPARRRCGDDKLHRFWQIVNIFVLLPASFGERRALGWWNR